MGPKSAAIFVFYVIFLSGGIFACGWLIDGYYSLTGNLGAFLGLCLGAMLGTFIGARQAGANDAMEYIKLNTEIEINEILDSLEKEGDKDN